MHKYFEWDENKNKVNLKKHGIDFENARLAFFDKKRIVAEDWKHSGKEKRIYCIGKVGSRILTVRYTNRKNKIRIFGAGFWEKGRKLYEKENNIYR